MILDFVIGVGIGVVAAIVCAAAVLLFMVMAWVAGGSH